MHPSDDSSNLPASRQEALYRVGADLAIAPRSPGGIRDDSFGKKFVASPLAR